MSLIHIIRILKISSEKQKRNDDEIHIYISNSVDFGRVSSLSRARWDKLRTGSPCCPVIDTFLAAVATDSAKSCIATWSGN